MTHTVFDPTNRNNHTEARAFLDPNGGVTIQRYETMKYRQFDKLTDKQLGFYWRPEEIDTTRDAKDFRDLSASEQHIFTSNLKRQILLDSVQGRSPNIAFLPIVSLPELEAWINTWAFFETIHSRSYTHIIRNVYPNPSVIFDGMMDIEEIVDCAKDISEHYDSLIDLSMAYHLLGEGVHEVKSPNGSRTIEVSLYELKKALYMAIMSVNILEGVRFYVSFACSWAFAETKRMESNAKIIKLICMSDDHEILTNQGWKKFADLTKDERVAQYTPEGIIEFVKPLAHIEEDFDGDMVKFETADVDALYTPDHRIIYKQDGVLRESTAAEFNPSCAKSYIVAGRKTSGRDELTDLERFRIAVQADGHISDRYTGELCGHIPVFFHLKKERKVARLATILDHLHWVGITHTQRKRDNGFVDFTVNVPISFAVAKDFSWVKIEEVSSIWADAFFEELSNWDGHLPKNSEGRIYYSSINSDCVDVVQALAAISDRRQHRSLQIDERKETYSDVHRLNTQTGTERCCGSNAKTKSFEHYQGKVYCVTVPSGMIVVRRNGTVYITGNCRDENLHLASTQALLKILPTDDPDYSKIAQETKDECIKLFADAAEQEKRWADFLFQGGSMLGLNYELLAQYVEWITNKRMIAVGLSPLYKTGANPLPWTQKWIAGAEVQVAPQETAISSYTIGATKQDVDNDTFKGFSL